MLITSGPEKHIFINAPINTVILDPILPHPSRLFFFFFFVMDKVPRSISLQHNFVQEESDLHAKCMHTLRIFDTCVINFVQIYLKNWKIWFCSETLLCKWFLEWRRPGCGHHHHQLAHCLILWPSWYFSMGEVNYNVILFFGHLHAENPGIQMRDPTFGIHSHKTLDTAQPCHLLKPNWKPSSSHSIFIPTNISTTPFLVDLHFFFFRMLQYIIKSSLHRDKNNQRQKWLQSTHISSATCMQNWELVLPGVLSLTPETFWWPENELHEKSTQHWNKLVKQVLVMACPKKGHLIKST